MFELPNGVPPNYLTLGPDGNVWFTADPGYFYSGAGPSAVGFRTPAGAVTEYALPTAGPAGITTGADGNIWFGETSANQIGRVTPSGAITEFSDNRPDNGDQNPVFNMAAGADGNVWVSGWYEGVVNQMFTGASTACSPVVTSTDPPSVTQGSSETVSTVIRNCSAAPHLIKLAVKTTPPSGCGTATTAKVNIPLQPLVQTTVASTFTAPFCPGAYKVKATLTVGTQVVGSTLTTYQVN